MQHQQSQQANGFGVFSASSPSLAANNSNGGGDGGGGQGGGGNNTMGDEDDDRENKIRIVAKLENPAEDLDACDPEGRTAFWHACAQEYGLCCPGKFWNRPEP